MLTMWELPTFATFLEAKAILQELSSALIKMQYQKTKKMSAKYNERTTVNDHMDEFIATVDDRAADALLEPMHTPALHAKQKAIEQQWLAIRNAAMEKRERLIRSKEQIRDLTKAF